MDELEGDEAFKAAQAVNGRCCCCGLSNIQLRLPCGCFYCYICWGRDHYDDHVVDERCGPTAYDTHKERE